MQKESARERRERTVSKGRRWEIPESPQPCDWVGGFKDRQICEDKGAVIKVAGVVLKADVFFIPCLSRNSQIESLKCLKQT